MTETLRAERSGTRVRPGERLAVRELEDVMGGRVRIPDGAGMVHLQFRRFAGCPVCSLHLRTMAARREEIAAAGIRPVAIFHSTAEDLRKYHADLPFIVIADPGKRLYAEFGVESSPRAVLDPRAWRAIGLGVARSVARVIGRGAPLPPVLPAGGGLGLPADILIDAEGIVLACKYGRHADDQWSVDELLEQARRRS